MQSSTTGEADAVIRRVPLDGVGADNPPRLIVPKSHCLGREAETDISSVVAKCGTFVCLAQAGDVWLYATPILHASDTAVSPPRRRVLQIDYCARDLPAGLDWLGI